MANKFYNLPPPWNPGYAIPEYVQQEGLERHAHVTKMLPRGTYDRSTDGSAGYAVPQYVLEERTGRGTYTSKWLPRGYYGPGIPHYLNRHPLPLIPMGDSEQSAYTGANPFVQYGQRSADVMLGTVQRLPKSQQAPALRMVMNKIDPKLVGRVEAETKKAIARGMPNNQALRVGIAAAMTTGILKELSDLGKTKKEPSRRSLLGLGIWGLGADGAVLDPGSSSSTTTTTRRRLLTNAVAPGGPTFAGGSAPVVAEPGHETRRGETDAERDARLLRELLDREGPQVQVGPFMIPVKSMKDKKLAKTYLIRDVNSIPPEWKPFIKQALLRGGGETGPRKPVAYPRSDYTVTSEDAARAAAATGSLVGKNVRSDQNSWFVWRKEGELWKDYCYWMSGFGIRCTINSDGPDQNLNPIRPAPPPVQVGQPVAAEMLADVPKRLTWDDFEGDNAIMPVAKFRNPDTGDDWGLFMSIVPEGYTGPTQVGCGNPGPNCGMEMLLYFAFIPKKPWYEKLKSALAYLPSKLIDAVGAIAEVIGDLACSALQTPGAAAGAAAASGGTAAIGVVVASSLCGPGQQKIPPPVEQPSMLMPLLLIGGGLAAVVLLTGKKKTETP